jgi:hypothetical protein
MRAISRPWAAPTPGGRVRVAGRRFASHPLKRERTYCSRSISGCGYRPTASVNSGEHDRHDAAGALAPVARGVEAALAWHGQEHRHHDAQVEVDPDRAACHEGGDQATTDFRPTPVAAT